MKDPYRVRSPVTGRERRPIEELRFLEIATFMRTPLITDLAEVDIALVGVPFDGGVTNRPGARHGPREIRNQSSQMRTIHPVTGISPYELCRIGDAGDVCFENLYDLAKAHDEITEFVSRLVEARIVPLVAGGDHSISFPILRAVAQEGPLALVHFDAHTDTWGEFKGSRFHHGAPFRLAVEEGLIDPERTIQIGIRGPQSDPDGWEFSQRSGMRVLFMHEVAEIGLDGAMREIRRVIGDHRAYVSFDIDSLDPAYAPGTGTPEIGGFTSLEAQILLRSLRGLDLVGADLVEVSPPFDPLGNTALVGASLLYELLSLLAESRTRRPA